MSNIQDLYTDLTPRLADQVFSQLNRSLEHAADGR
jgi:hypothetical protein